MRIRTRLTLWYAAVMIACLTLMSVLSERDGDDRARAKASSGIRPDEVYPSAPAFRLY